MKPALLVPALLALPVFSSVVAVAAPVSVASTRQADDDAELERRKAAAGDDVAKLWDLHLWCKERGRSRECDETLARIVELDPDHAEARKALGHRFYDGRWFEGPIELSKYKRAEEKRMLEEHGLVRFGDDWVPEGDVPFRRMGWTKDAEGRWRSPAELERLEREARWQEEGWRQQNDLVWVSPDEVGRWQENLWKCGDEWLSLEDANAWHARLGRGWTLPGERFVVDTTLDNNWGWAAVGHADSTFADLARAFGAQPAERPEVVVCRDLAQYNTLAAGAPARQIAPVEQSGWSALHYAYFAESWFSPAPAPAYRGRGVAYWENGSPWGPFSIRHAAAHSYAEAVDPSWDAVSRTIASGANLTTDAFWREKRIPLWFRFGVASWVERFRRDPDPEAAEPFAVRTWAIAELAKQGGPRPLAEVFAFRLDANQPQTALLVPSAGLVTAFVLDGGCKPVTDAHAALKQALRAAEDTADEVAALQAAITAHEAELRAFAGL